MQNHIKHILVAEFDIDKGSQLSHQYPEKTGIEEHKLAELMLPDGAHLREEDWTFFILNQHVIEDVSNILIKLCSFKFYNLIDSDFPELPLPSVNNEGNALYVLNLVRTKQIPGVRRGARVKAIAITSHHKWLHVFKPLLIMALDNYFETPELFIIEQLYKSMNSLDISLMPLLSLNEKIILRASDDPMLFNESFVDMEEFAKIMNKYNVQLKNNQIRKIDRHFFETNVLYDNGNKNPVKVPIKIPMTMFNGEFGDLSVIQLISTFGNSAYPTKHHPQLDNNIPTNPIIILINALLTQKRVLFLGHLKPSGEVANFVLAACALGSCGILRGYTERCFPYTNLAGLDDLLKVPGYIAGVTNPAFEEHPQWWDVLFNINTGKVTISPNIEKASPVENPLFSINEKELLASSMDKEFMNDIMSLIQQKYGEHYIRERFRLYLIRFIEVASEYERIVFNRTKIGYSHETIHDKYKIGVGAYFPDDLSKHREIAYNINRIEGWRKTRSYELYVKDFHKNMLRRSVRCVDIRRQALALRNEVSISDEQLSGIMTALAENISTDEQVLEFLTHFLHNQGGLLPIAYPLLHKSESIRINCTKVLVRLDYSPVSKKDIKYIKYNDYIILYYIILYFILFN
ncbi:spindle pole body interacting protein [Anaeromyces robustus]|uniref:Spindle pole body interacting protein n=1 Tax=Anaeromyces robustus TaxID=1754192 RepID=A0A1Y1XPI4_9FUNG|nr:spindle pole body interacting protein [Anaeromyces robustus]|eukprot:ORX87658.1 spindle pole body interacting protein [Anaeromyces robustus]